MSTRCRKIKETDLERIMEWRMMPEITAYMNTDPVLTMEGQLKWYEKIKNSKDEMYWILEVDDEPVGVVNYANWDKKNSIIHTGVYIAVKEKRSIKLTVNLQMSLYFFAFEILKVNKVSMEILSNNKGMIDLNQRLGAHLDGVLREEICKKNQYYDLYLLSLLASEWEKIKQKVKHEIIEFEV
ncbi:MAG: UDP-4-amino-4,6-dideoxy-N-acetyl-beta-L-altrosamine N-acetyltransferase [Lachnospiraceae bacterium]